MNATRTICNTYSVRACYDPLVVGEGEATDPGLALGLCASCYHDLVEANPQSQT